MREIKDPDLRNAIKDTILETLDIKFTEFTKERIVATMPVTPKVHQPYGIMHGGASVVLAESVASAGCSLFIDMEKQRMVGLEINANHIRSISEGIVRGVGTPIHIGRSTMVWEVRILDEEDRLICISRCTIAILNNKK
ncbi:MAG: hotdog fold thioesterase [Syntrophomonadaceae bacterium]